MIFVFTFRIVLAWSLPTFMLNSEAALTIKRYSFLCNSCVYVQLCDNTMSHDLCDIKKSLVIAGLHCTRLIKSDWCSLFYVLFVLCSLFFKCHYFNQCWMQEILFKWYWDLRDHYSKYIWYVYYNTVWVIFTLAQVDAMFYI